MIKWVIDNCKFKYFIKNDQDVVPNLKLIYNFLKLKQNNCSYGIVKIKEKVCRNKYSRSYIPYSSYNKSVLPSYIFGFFAIYYYRLLIEINRISFNTYPVIYKEDVHIGLLASKSNYAFCQLKFKIMQRKKYDTLSNITTKRDIISIHGVNQNYNAYYYSINNK